MIGTMVREVVSDGCAVQLDLSGQVLELDAPENKDAPELSPSPEFLGDFLSGAVIAQKAKLFDDALYASVELAAQSGWGNFPSKAGFVRRFAESALLAGECGEGARMLLAACELGGIGPPPLSPGCAALVRETVQQFLADEERSKPLGFYTASEALGAIFRQDRMLMGEFKKPGSADLLAQVLQAGAALRAEYQQLLALAARITNPPPGDAADLLQEGGASESCPLRGRMKRTL